MSITVSTPSGGVFECATAEDAARVCHELHAADERARLRFVAVGPVRVGDMLAIRQDLHAEVEVELARALAKYPDCESLPNGTGASGYKTFETIARLSCERAYREGRITHAHIFEEEAAEVLAAEDPAAIRKELIQVAAIAVKWVRDIDRKTLNDQPPASSSVSSPSTAGATQGPEGTEQAETSVTREAPAPAPDVEGIPGAAVAAPQAEVLVCHSLCGRPSDVTGACPPRCAGKNGRCWCTEACRKAGRPLNPAPEVDRQGNPRIYPCADCGTMRSAPEGGTTFTVCDECWDKHYPKSTAAPEVQPVPAGYRLGDGWKMSGYQGRSECFCAANALFFVKPPSAAISALCPAHAVELGALVPIEPTAAPEGQQGEPGCRGRECADSTCPTCEAVPDAAWIAWKTGKSPEGQQGEAKASEPGKVPLSTLLHEAGQFALEHHAAAIETELAEAKLAAGRRVDSIMDARKERDTARAEVEQLRGKLAEATTFWNEYRGRAEAWERTAMKLSRTTDAREAAMRAAVVIAARDEFRRCLNENPVPQPSNLGWRIISAIERLPLSTEEATPAGQASEVDWSAFLLPAPDPGRIEDIELGAVFASWTFDGTPETFRPSIRFNIGPDRNGQNTKLLAGCPDWNMGCVRLVRHADGRWARGFGQTGEAQPDAIKAAVTAANNRAADAFVRWWNSDEPHGEAPEKFEAWLRSGAPVTVGGGK